MTTSDAIAVTAFATTSFMLGIYQTGLCSGPTGRSGSCSAFETLYAASVPAAYEVSSALSLFLAVFAVVTFYLAIASLRTDLVLTVIIWLIFVGLVLLSIGFGTSSGNVVNRRRLGRSRLRRPGLVSRRRRCHRCHLRPQDPSLRAPAGQVIPDGSGQSARRLVGELQQHRQCVIGPTWTPQVAEVRGGLPDPPGVEATQVPGHRRPQIELVQQAERDKPRTQIWFR